MKRISLDCSTYVELPSLEMLTCVAIGDDDDQLGNLAVFHPPVKRCHDALYVGFDLVVGRDEHVEAIFLHDSEVLGGVHATLVENGVDGVLELYRAIEGSAIDQLWQWWEIATTYELGDELRAAFERKLVHLGGVLVLLFFGGLFGGCHGGNVSK